MRVLLGLLLLVAVGAAGCEPGAGRPKGDKPPPPALLEAHFPGHARPCWWEWGPHLYRVTFSPDGTYTATEGADRWEGRWWRQGNVIGFAERYAGRGAPGGKEGAADGPERTFRVHLFPGRGGAVGSVEGDYTLRHVGFFGYD